MKGRGGIAVLPGRRGEDWGELDGEGHSSDRGRTAGGTVSRLRVEPDLYALPELPAKRISLYFSE